MKDDQKSLISRFSLRQILVEILESIVWFLVLSFVMGFIADQFLHFSADWYQRGINLLRAFLSSV